MKGGRERGREGGVSFTLVGSDCWMLARWSVRREICSKRKGDTIRFTYMFGGV